MTLEIFSRQLINFILYFFLFLHFSKVELFYFFVLVLNRESEVSKVIFTINLIRSLQSGKSKRSFLKKFEALDLDVICWNTPYSKLTNIVSMNTTFDSRSLHFLKTSKHSTQANISGSHLFILTYVKNDGTQVLDRKSSCFLTQLQNCTLTQKASCSELYLFSLRLCTSDLRLLRSGLYREFAHFRDSPCQLFLALSSSSLA